MSSILALKRSRRTAETPSSNAPRAVAPSQLKRIRTHWRELGKGWLWSATMLNMVAERRSLILRGVLDVCLLALLEEQPVYGYELTERLGARDLLVSGGSSYPLLARLEKAGLVQTERRPSQTGPPRKYYSLTDQGRAALESGRAEWLAVAGSVTALLTEPAAPDFGEEV